MSNRAIRRAAERQAQKLAAKASKVMTASATPNWDSWDGWDSDAPTPEPPTDNGEPANLGNRPISAARLAANRENSKHSTGAKTPEGKEKSKMNALKHGLTSQTILFAPGEDKVYQAFVESLYQQWSPATDQEKRLTQLIADTEWRIHRVATLETNLFALGSMEQPNTFAAEPDFLHREALQNTKIHLIYEKQFKNLALVGTSEDCKVLFDFIT